MIRQQFIYTCFFFATTCRSEKSRDRSPNPSRRSLACQCLPTTVSIYTTAKEIDLRKRSTTEGGLLSKILECAMSKMAAAEGSVRPGIDFSHSTRRFISSFVIDGLLDRHGRRHHFSNWMKRLAHLKNSSSESNSTGPSNKSNNACTPPKGKKNTNKNNPYPSRAQLVPV
jgi:hypothetical protein